MATKRLIGTVLLTACGLVAAACGDDDDQSATGTSVAESPASTEGDASAPTGERSQVRLSYQPDPVIQWMDQQGMFEAFEDQYNVEFVQTETFDPGPAFLGNRADIISVGTFEIAAIEQETGLKTVTFGRTGDNYSIIAVRGDDPAETLADLQGRKVGSRGGGAGPLSVAVIAEAVHGLEYKAEGGEGGDFETVLVDDHQVNIDLLLRGDVDAIAVTHGVVAKWLRTGEMKALYDGKMAYEIMTDAVGEGERIGFGINNLVAREDWFDSHPNEVQFLLAVYDEAAKVWKDNMSEIVQEFGQDFNVESPEDAEYIIDIFEASNFLPDTAYLDEAYVEGERKILDLMADVGLLDPEKPQPRFEIVEPA